MKNYVISYELTCEEFFQYDIIASSKDEAIEKAEEKMNFYIEQRGLHIVDKNVFLEEARTFPYRFLSARTL
jgi:hypothetical protein